MPPCMVDAEEGVTADDDVLALFEGLDGDGVAGAWVDRPSTNRTVTHDGGSPTEMGYISVPDELAC